MPRVHFSRCQRPVLSLALGLILCLPLEAQKTFDSSRNPSIHGVPPSVTSFGFGGVRGPRGIPPSVTSPGFGDIRFRLHPVPVRGHHHGVVSPFFGAGYYVLPYVPYGPDYSYPYDVVDPGVDDTMEENYAAGPTIFDRPGQGSRDYLRPAGAGQSGQAPTIKDPAEYNAYVGAVQQHDLTDKASALEAFLTQYPDSVMKRSVLETLMGTYQQISEQAKMVAAAKRLLQADPNNLRATRRPQSTPPEATGENATLATEMPQPAEQPSTILIFRDGHELEISNYAILGSTLYDLSGGHTRKFDLAELDLAATVKQNDQHGVDFRLPKGLN